MNKDWEFNHSGIFTKDFNGTIAYYKDLGIAADLPRTGPAWNPEDKVETIEFDVVPDLSVPEGDPFLYLLYIGDLEFEILHAPDKIPYGEMLSYREGVNHFCISVPDIDGETEKLVKKGLRIVQDFHRNGERHEDYLDTRHYGYIFLSFRSPMTEEMKKRKAEAGIVDWKFIGHTAIVQDLDKVVEKYRYWEIADFQPEKMIDTRAMSDVQIYGKPPKAEIKARTRTCQVGDRLMLELVQPVESDFIYRETLYRRGEGIIDITFSVKDLEKEKEMLVNKGVNCIYSATPKDSGAFAVFDVREKGGDVLIKLAEE
jgi:catechol 2,3-dioxygenase-like lactoylglutathione lyase family enzyme